jgi:hypothetical protein
MEAKNGAAFRGGSVFLARFLFKAIQVFLCFVPAPSLEAAEFLALPALGVAPVLLLVAGEPASPQLLELVCSAQARALPAVDEPLVAMAVSEPERRV